MIACMDARLNVYGALGLTEGDAYVIRNAGGVITDDEIRSLAISQRLLGTAKVILIHFTDCGMLTFTDDEVKNSIEQELGIKPEWAAESFPDLETDVRQSIARINAPNYPIIGDADFNVAKLYGMLPAATSGEAKGRNFDEVLRVIDSLQLTAKHRVSTPGRAVRGDGDRPPRLHRGRRRT